MTWILWLMNNQLTIVYTAKMHNCEHKWVCTCLVCMPTPLSLNCVAVKLPLSLCMLACVCFLPHQAPQCSLPVHSINAQPCPRLICHSCCIFAFILICTSPPNWLSICPGCCSNLIVFVHYRWASNNIDRHTRTHTPLLPLVKPPLFFRNRLLTTPTTHIPRLSIFALYLMS